MTANEKRGEIDLDLAGERFVLRPSYEAIQAFESQIGKSLIELAQGAGDGTMSLSHAAIIATECIKAWGKATENATARAVNAKRVGELIFEGRGGLMVVLKKLEILLFMAATGGVTIAGEMKPVTTKTAETSTGA